MSHDISSRIELEWPECVPTYVHSELLHRSYWKTLHILLMYNIFEKYEFFENFSEINGNYKFKSIGLKIALDSTFFLLFDAILSSWLSGFIGLIVIGFCLLTVNRFFDDVCRCATVTGPPCYARSSTKNYRNFRRRDNKSRGIRIWNLFLQKMYRTPKNIRIVFIVRAVVFGKMMWPGYLQSHNSGVDTRMPSVEIFIQLCSPHFPRQFSLQIPSARSVGGLIIPNFCMGFSIGMMFFSYVDL